MNLDKIERIVITGSRDWTDREVIESVLWWLWPKRVAHGGCRGADEIANDVVMELLLPEVTIITYEADWEEHGRGAGPIRNREMLDTEEPDLVVGFLLPGSRGTRDCLEAARERGIPVLTFEPGKVDR